MKQAIRAGVALPAPESHPRRWVAQQSDCGPLIGLPVSDLTRAVHVALVSPCQGTQSQSMFSQAPFYTGKVLIAEIRRNWLPACPCRLWQASIWCSGRCKTARPRV